jgi:hypothetical protein
MALFEIIKKILGTYALLLTIIGTIGNALIFLICIKKEMRRINTFKFLAFISISDLIALYEWNLKHFIAAFFGIDFNFMSLAWCRLSLYLQYVTLQFSAWILVNIYIIILHYLY